MPVDGVEVEHRGRIEARVPAEPGHRIRDRTPERAGRDVRIAERDDRHPATGERPHERQRRAGRLLGVVENQEPEVAEAAESAGRDGARDECRRLAQKFGRVEVAVAEARLDVVVDAEEAGRGDPLRPVEPGPELPELLRGDAEFDAAHHEIPQLRAEPSKPAHVGVERLRPRRPGALFDVAVQQLGEDLVLLAAGEQPGRLRPGTRRRIRRQFESQGLRSAGERSEGRYGEPQSEAIPQSRRAGARGGEHEQFVSRPALLDPPRDQFDQGRRLARPWRAEYRRTGVLRQIENRGLGSI